MNSIPYGKQEITESDITAVVDALTSDFLTQGPKISEFEARFSEYIGSKFAVAVSNGTAALHLCAMALKINPSSNVITTPITFAASANCVKYCGGTVYFADIDPKTYCLDIAKVQELIDTKPEGFFQGIIPVDFAGYPMNTEALRQVANANNLWILEDACHAPGGYLVDSKNKVQKCGNNSYTDLSIFSFHPVKHIACGEGGMITTDNEQLYKKLLLLRTHGITKEASQLQENHGGWYYEMQELGYNYRLTDIQAALGISQLTRAEQGLERRREIAARYFDAFKDEDFILGQSGIVEGHAYHLYIIEVENRLALYNHLRARNIFAQVHYIPVHTLPYYQSLGWLRGQFPKAEQYYEQCLSLPMYPSLKETEQLYVIEQIKQFYRGK